jgi:hypothetical protein
MSNTLARFYTNLLLAEVSSGMQKRIYDYGRARKDVGLLVALAGYASLCTEVDTKLATESNAKVRSAWIRNPLRTSEQIAASIEKEKRVTVLTVIAESDEGLPDSAFDALVKQADTSGSAMLALTVAANEAAPEDVRARAAVVFARHCGQLRRPEHTKLGAVVAHADRMAMVTKSVSLAVFLTSAGDLSAKSIANLTRLLTAKRHLSDLAYGSTSALQNLLNSSFITVESAEQIHAFAQWSQAEGSKSSYYYYGSSMKDLETLAAKVIDQGGGNGSSTRSFHKLSDPADIDAAITEMQAQASGSNHAAFIALVSNECLSDEQFERMISRGSHHLPWSALSALPGMLVGHPNRMLALFSNYPHLLTDEILAAVPDPAALLSAFASRLSSMPGHVSNYILESLVRSQHFTADIAMMMPVALFRGPQLDVNAVTRIIEVLEPHVSDDSLWHTFEMLAPEFDGSVSDLLSACTSL